MIYLLGDKFEMAGMLDNFYSFVWNLKYFGCSEFEFYTNKEISGRYAYDNSINIAGIVEGVEIEGSKYKYTGRSLKALLANRVISQRITYTNKTTEFIVKDLVQRFAGQNIAIEPNKDRGKIVDTLQVEGENLMEFTDTLLEDYELASIVWFDYDTKQLTFSIYESIDNSKKIPLSDSFENLNGYVYNKDMAEFKNYIYVAGEEEEGKKRQIVTVDYRLNPEEERRELWLSASARQNYTDDNGQEVILSDEQYRKALEEEGRKKLNEYQILETINLDAKIDLQLGEKRTFRADNYFSTQIITEMLIGYEKNQTRKEYTFGLQKLTSNQLTERRLGK